LPKLIEAAELSVRKLLLLQNNLEDEINKHQRYEKDAARRSHDYGKFIRVFLEKLHQNGVLNDVIDFQRSVQQIKPKPAPIRARRRSKKMEN